MPAPSAPSPTTPAAMVEQAEGLVSMNVSFDLRDILMAATGIGYDPEADEEHLRGQLADTLLDRAAQKLAKGNQYEVRDQIRAAVHQAVYEQVKDTLTDEALFTGTGGKQASLRDMVLEAAQKWPNERADSYERSTRLQKLIQEQLAEVFRKELAPVVEAAKREVVEAIRAKASEMIVAAAGDLNRAVGR